MLSISDSIQTALNYDTELYTNKSIEDYHNLLTMFKIPCNENNLRL